MRSLAPATVSIGGTRGRNDDDDDDDDADDDDLAPSAVVVNAPLPTFGVIDVSMDNGNGVIFALLVVVVVVAGSKRTRQLNPLSPD